MKLHVFSGILAALVFILLFASQLEAATEEPNLVLILSDDQAWTDCRFIRDEFVRTSNLNRLAPAVFPFGCSQVDRLVKQLYRATGDIIQSKFHLSKIKTSYASLVEFS